VSRAALLAGLAAAALLSAAARADGVDGTYLKYGIGIFHSADYGTAETKTFALGYKDGLVGPLVQQREVGLWVDPAGHGRSSSGYANYSVGAEATPGYLVASAMWGVAAITTPDSMLGGWFQFKNDTFLGVKDDRGNTFGLNYTHVSSAGIESPNMGRDMLSVKVGIPW
jgi:hypothetical protein